MLVVEAIWLAAMAFAGGIALGAAVVGATRRWRR